MKYDFSPYTICLCLKFLKLQHYLFIENSNCSLFCDTDYFPNQIQNPNAQQRPGDSASIHAALYHHSFLICNQSTLNRTSECCSWFVTDAHRGTTVAMSFFYILKSNLANNLLFMNFKDPRLLTQKRNYSGF